MSIEKNIESIAKSLYRMTELMELYYNATPVTTAAPVVQAAATPVVQAAAAPVVQAVAAAPQVTLVAAAPVVQAAAAGFDSPVVAAAPVVQAAALPAINTPEEMNALLVAEFGRLGAVHGEGARALIVNKLKEVGGSESVQGIPVANYPAVLAAVKALV